MKVQREDVLAALRAEDMVNHLGIKGTWRGQWLRSSRCGVTDHGSDAFGIKRDGHWHCWSCDAGGDLLGLVAVSEGLDIKVDFPRVLEVAAGIAGIAIDDGSDLFGVPDRPAPKPRVEMPPPPPLHQRLAHAKRRALWAWSNLWTDSRAVPAYLRSRGLDPDIVMARETIRSTPLRLERGLIELIRTRDSRVSDDLQTLWYTMGTRRGTMSIVVPVRDAKSGEMVDLRARRVEPEPGQPKIIGMVGGVTSAPAERGRPRSLIGCYGNPHLIDADHVVIGEGLMDYLTGLQVWPNATVLGAVEAGTLSLVTAWAASALAARDNESRLTIVEQSDPARLNKATGKMVPGAADAAINEDPNAATKVALRILRDPRRLGWLYCQYPGDDGEIGSPRADLDGKPVKDLNDLVRVGANVSAMTTWWADRMGTGDD
jgi:hypothetical protein